MSEHHRTGTARLGRRAGADGPKRRFPTVSVVSRSGQVADIVRSAILSGELVPGEQLKQDDLRAELGVSPTPIREALRRLESEGLVTHYPNRGVFVASVSSEELFAVLLPVRLTLERYAISRSLAGRTAELFDALEEQVRLMKQGAAANDRASVVEADMAFHELLVEYSGAPHTTQLWRAVQPRVRVVMYQLGPRHALSDIPAEHVELLAALKKGDLAEIDAVLERHIIGDAQRLSAWAGA